MSNDYITVNGKTAKSDDILIGVDMVKDMVSYLIERNSMNPNAVNTLNMVQGAIAQLKNEIYECK